MLYYNDETKVIFGSDQPQDLAICRAITEDEIPDLIANGAGVGPSENYQLPNVDAAESSGPDSAAIALTPVATPIDQSDLSANPETDSSANRDAPATQDTDVPVISSGTAGEQGNVSSTSGDLKPGAGVDDLTSTDVPVPDADHSPEQRAAALDVMWSNAQNSAPLSSGTAVEVKQVGDGTVNTGIQQNGNVLAGTTGNQLANSGVTLDAPTLIVPNTENDLNPLVPAAGTEGPPASQLAAQAELPEAEELPRESHLMLMESKFAAIIAKLRNQERVAVDELEAVYAHVKAVL